MSWASCRSHVGLPTASSVVLIPNVPTWMDCLKVRQRNDAMSNGLGVPKTVDRSTFQAALDTLRVREKAHTREGDAIAAARRRLPMVEVDAATLYGRQEKWEESPTGWPQGWGEGKQRMRADGRPIAQWRRLKAGHSDDLDAGSR